MYFKPGRSTKKPASAPARALPEKKCKCGAMCAMLYPTGEGPCCFDSDAAMKREKAEAERLARKKTPEQVAAARVAAKKQSAAKLEKRAAQRKRKVCA